MIFFFHPINSILYRLLPDSIRQKHARDTKRFVVNSAEKLSPDLAEKIDALFESSKKLDQTIENAAIGVAAVVIKGVPVTIIEQAFANARHQNSTHTGVQIEDCKIGDHLKRTGAPIPLYSHHAIYIGEGCVMHYAGPINNVEIQVSTLEEFSLGRHIDIVPEYNSALLVSREEAVARAYQRYSEHDYNLVLNNCEHFVRWCRTGD